MLEHKSNFKAWLYLSPALALLLVFTFYPIVNAFLLVFMKDFQYMTGQYAGWTLTDNIEYVIGLRTFRRALGNTFIIVFVTVPVSVMISLFLSVWLNSIKKFQGFFQTIFFLPYVTNAIAVGMAFAFMFNMDYGLINVLLGWFGINPVNWIGPSATWGTAMFALLVFVTWGSLAFKIMVFLSGLQSIDKQYYDAARIDSAPRRRIFRHITVPLLSPMIAYITITSFIGAFKEYTAIIGMFGERLAPPGSERNLLITIVGVVYESLGETYPGATSEAAAAAIILFFMTLILTLFNMYISKKRVHF